MQVVSIGYGKVNGPGMTATLSAFVLKTGPARQGMYPNRDFPNLVATRHGKVQHYPVSPHGDSTSGSLNLDSLHIEDGTVLALQCSHAARNLPVRDAAVLLRVRDQGPIVSVTANLLSIQQSLYPTFLAFNGRADVLKTEDAARYQIDLPKSWVDRFRDPEELTECFTVAYLGPELAPKQEVEVAQTSDGETVVLSSKPRRRLKLR